MKGFAIHSENSTLLAVVPRMKGVGFLLSPLVFLVKQLFHISRCNSDTTNLKVPFSEISSASPLSYCCILCSVIGRADMSW